MGYIKDIMLRIQNGDALNVDEAKIAKDAGYDVKEINGSFFVKIKE